MPSGWVRHLLDGFWRYSNRDKFFEFAFIVQHAHSRILRHYLFACQNGNSLQKRLQRDVLNQFKAGAMQRRQPFFQLFAGQIVLRSHKPQILFYLKLSTSANLCRGSPGSAALSAEIRRAGSHRITRSFLHGPCVSLRRDNYSIFICVQKRSGDIRIIQCISSFLGEIIGVIILIR